MMMTIGPKHHLSNIWSSNDQKGKQHWGWVKKRAVYIFLVKHPTLKHMLLLLDVCKQTFRLSKNCISQKRKVTIMWNLWHQHIHGKIFRIILNVKMLLYSGLLWIFWLRSDGLRIASKKILVLFDQHRSLTTLNRQKEPRRKGRTEHKCKVGNKFSRRNKK